MENTLFNFLLLASTYKNTYITLPAVNTDNFDLDCIDDRMDVEHLEKYYDNKVQIVEILGGDHTVYEIEGYKFLFPDGYTTYNFVCPETMPREIYRTIFETSKLTTPFEK